MANNKPKRRAAHVAAIEDPGQPDLPEQGNDIRPHERSRRQAAADRIELSRAGVALSGAEMDDDPALDTTTETEAELRESTSERKGTR